MLCSTTHSLSDMCPQKASDFVGTQYIQVGQGKMISVEDGNRLMPVR